MGRVPKKLATILMVIIATWTVGIRLAEASCAWSSMVVAAVQGSFAPAVSAVWRIDPPCDVIETGLLFGADQAALIPVGQPIHGYRQAYNQEIPVSESGGYWVAAYAMDEAGSIIHSALYPVIVLIPPKPQAGSEGSHGAPPFYTGTDEDFLKPAGEPHFASLKAVNATGSSLSFSPLQQSRFATSFRAVASTERDAIVPQLVPQDVGGIIFTFDPAHVAGRLDQLDAHFLRFGFPRSGLYFIACNQTKFQLKTEILFQFGACEPIEPWFGLRGLGLGFTERRTETTGPDGSIVETQSISNRSSVTFFIPNSPERKRVQTARLGALVATQTSPSEIPAGIRLNGKPPATVDNLQCQDSSFFPGLRPCVGIFTWDFTEEARSIAAQGGGELTLVPDLLPLVSGERANPASGGLFRFSLSGLSLELAPNYPWRHRREESSLALTFEEDCPKGLNLVLTPETVRPQIPGEPVPQVTVDARVTTCPPQPGSPLESVVVTLMIDPNEPVQGSVDAGEAIPIMGIGQGAISLSQKLGRRR